MNASSDMLGSSLSPASSKAWAAIASRSRGSFQVDAHDRRRRRNQSSRRRTVANSPSARRDVKKQVWHCRGCSQGGSVIDLIMHIRKLDFREAVEWLVGGDTRPVPVRAKPAPSEPNNNSDNREKALALWRAATPFALLKTRTACGCGLQSDVSTGASIRTPSTAIS
jgi:CHC2 zinc finger